MKGLILKDLINLKKQLGISTFVLLVYFLMSLGGDSTNLFNIGLILVSAVMPISAFAYDERAKWDKYALTMPVSRKDMVISKYILAIGALTIALIGIFIFESTANKQLQIQTPLIYFSIGIIYLSVMIPIIFKLGVEKSRILQLIIFLIPMGIVYLLSNLGFSIPQKFIDTLPILIPLAVIIIIIISINTSLAIYHKKEI